MSSSVKHQTKGDYQAVKSADSEWPPNRYNKKDGVHLNNLWSIWYGIICAVLQGYLAYKCLKEILGYSVLTWPDGLPYLELNCSLGLNGAVFLLLPIFFTVTILKIGNLANDGYKLGRQTSMCSREPTDVLGGGANCGLFRYGGPTAPFIHIAIAFCLLIPKVLMEAKMIQAGFLSQDFIWHTDLDFMITHKNRSVVLSFNPLSANGSESAGAMSMDEMTQRFYDPSKIMTFSSANLTHTVIKTLKDFIGHETKKYEAIVGDGIWHSSMSLEYVNLITALVIYSVRYPALFWSANKTMGLLFSFMLFVNGLQIVLSFAGISILYKIHVADMWNYVSFSQPRIYPNFAGLSPFLLNAQVTFGLYMLTTLLMLASSVVMYFYGHTRFTEFINHQRDKKLITLPGSFSSVWVYFTHCAAFCVIMAIGICNAPLVHDFVVAYRGSQNEVQLMCVIYDLFHLLFWSFTWIFLSAKHKWTFKIRISIGEAIIKESQSLRLIHSVHLNNQQNTEQTSTQQPLLIIGNGRTYTVAETLPKRAIMEVLQRSALVKRSKSNGSMAVSEDMNEEIYWLRPTLEKSSQAQKRSKYLRWFRRKSRQNLVDISNTSPKRAKSNVRNSVIPGIEEDDGDYATLRELPLAPGSVLQGNVTNVNSGSEGKLLAAVHDEDITYASANKDFTPPSLYQEHNPLLEPIVVHTDFVAQQKPSTSGNTERLLRTDSGILAHEELSRRSNSLSTECSVSPPDPPGSSHSESSSGVHSNDSNETSIIKQPANAASDWKSSQSDVNSNGDLNPESTVVIRRKSIRPNPNEGVSEAILKEDPYGRATNMRMTSFMDSKGALSQSSSATLPHYPTQPSIQNLFSNNCSTMPLPQHTSASIPQPMVNGNSCNVYTNRLHTTIPTHLNGVKLVTTAVRINEATPSIAKLEPIYTKINRVTNEICHYSSTRHS